MITRTAEAWAEELCPEWVTILAPPPHDGPFHVPVHAKACRPAVTAALKGLMEENARLRTDLTRGEIVATCEGCQAPLYEGDEFVSSEDCSGCWAAMTDAPPSNREWPCYAYRVGKQNAERTAPPTTPRKP